MTSGLWRNADFRNLWIGQTSSMFGTNMTAVAIPIIASDTLGASAFEMGLLVAAEFLPYLLISMFVGVWLDHRAKRPVVMLADVVRAVVLLAVPAAWLGHMLSMPLLLGVVLLVGGCSVVSDIGDASYLPELVDRDNLIEGNSKLEVSSSVANISGMALGGAVIEVVAAPIAVFYYALTYVVSAGFTSRIKKPGSPAGPAVAETSLLQNAGQGLSFVLQKPVLRTLVGSTVIANFSAMAIDPIFLLLITRTLRLPALVIGIVMAAMGGGSLIGALVAGPLSRKVPFGRLVVNSSIVIALASVLTPVAALMPQAPAVALLIVMQVLNAAMVIVCNINIRSYRTSLTPDDMQGRMNAVVRMAVMSGTPFGALLGGALGTWLGVPAALAVASAGLFLAAAIIGFSPVRHVTGIPTRAGPTADGVGTEMVA